MSYPPQPPSGNPGEDPTQAFPPQGGYPPQGTPAPGYPPQGTPAPGAYPPPGAPGGYPQGTPAPGYAPQGTPAPGGYPPQGPPGGYAPQGAVPPPPGGFPPPGGGFPPPGPKKKGVGAGAIIGIVAVVVIAIIVAAVGVLLITGGDDDEPTATRDRRPTTTAASGSSSDSTTSTTEADSTTTTAPESTSTAEDMGSGRSSTSGFIASGGSEIITVEVPGTLTLTVTPDENFDVTLTVNGGQFDEHYLDEGFAGEPEIIELPAGEYQVTVAGFVSSSGGYFAELG